MIKVSIREITSKGLAIEHTIPKEGIGLSDEEIDLRSPLKIRAYFQRAGDVISATARVEADFGFLCARCLQELHAANAFDYTFHFEVKSGDEYVDLGEEIRQELILANPARVLCKPDCQGICPGCGVNLNHGHCRCSSAEVKTEK